MEETVITSPTRKVWFAVKETVTLDCVPLRERPAELNDVLWLIVHVVWELGKMAVPEMVVSIPGISVKTTFPVLTMVWERSLIVPVIVVRVCPLDVAVNDKRARAIGRFELAGSTAVKISLT